MRKLRKYILLLILVLFVMFIYQLFHFDNRYFVGNKTYEQYNPTTKYEDRYPVSNYVTERMDASAILRSGVIGSMSKYDQLVDEENFSFDQLKTMLGIFLDRSTYIKITQQYQYQESTPVSVKYVGEQGNHNFEYTGYLEDGTEVTGNFAIWGTTGDVLTAISFQDGDGNIDADKARLFTDDSNAEMMAYLLIESAQAYLGTDLEPNEAAMTFFNCSLENVAGSISYHAATSLASLEIPMGDLTIEKVKTANISTIDEDGFLVNQSY